MEQYYVNNKKKLIRELKGFLKLIKPEIIGQYGADQYSKIASGTIKAYENLIPSFPLYWRKLE